MRTIKRASAHQRLLELPPVFGPGDLAAQFGPGGIATARVLLTRWARAGLVQPVSCRGGVAMNLVKLRAAASEEILDGGGRDVGNSGPGVWGAWLDHSVARAFPSAVRVGAGVLHEAGWITQLPRALTVAVLRHGGGSKSRIHEGLSAHLQIVARPPSWYEAVHEGGGVQVMTGRRAPMMSLTAPWALADAIAFGPARSQRLSLDADDLEWDAISEDDRRALAIAVRSLARCAAVRLPSTLLADWDAGNVGDDAAVAEWTQEALSGVLPRSCSMARRRPVRGPMA